LELTEALRTTGAIRQFTEQPVGDDQLYGILDSARFAPSGGNRQCWRVIIVKNPEIRRAVRELYSAAWYEYLAQNKAGLVAWAPITDRAAERQSLTEVPNIAAKAAAGPGGFAEHIDDVPALLVILADLRSLSASDRDLDRYSIIGGASVYPFAWNVLLAASDVGIGGVMTTVLTHNEAEVRDVLGVPDEYAVAAMLALGYPVKRTTRLRRSDVESFATIDRFSGDPLKKPN
jgi:nitroreductase